MLPAGTWAESTGTYVSAEGRAQRFFAPVFAPDDEIRDPSALAARAARLARPPRGPRLDLGRRGARRLGRGTSPARGGARRGPRRGLPPRRRPRRASARRLQRSHGARCAPDRPRAAAGRGPRFATRLLARRRARATGPGAAADGRLESRLELGEQRGQVPAGGERATARRAEWVRLFAAEGTSAEPPAFFAADRIPPAFVPHEGEWLLVPLHHIYGSEPLSGHTPGVAERAPSLTSLSAQAKLRRPVSSPANTSLWLCRPASCACRCASSKVSPAASPACRWASPASPTWRCPRSPRSPLRRLGGCDGDHVVRFASAEFGAGQAGGQHADPA